MDDIHKHIEDIEEALEGLHRILARANHNPELLPLGSDISKAKQTFRDVEAAITNLEPPIHNPYDLTHELTRDALLQPFEQMMDIARQGCAGHPVVEYIEGIYNFMSNPDEYKKKKIICEGLRVWTGLPTITVAEPILKTDVILEIFARLESYARSMELYCRDPFNTSDSEEK